MRTLAGYMSHAIEDFSRADQVEDAALLQPAGERAGDRVDVDVCGRGLHRLEHRDRAVDRAPVGLERCENLIVQAIQQVGGAIADSLFLLR